MNTGRVSPLLHDESQAVTSQPGGPVQLRISRTPFGRSNRQSAVLLDVPTLESLAMRVFLRQLERTLEGPSCRGRLSLPASVVQPLRCVCHERIPARLRQHMLDHVLASGRVYNTVDMRLLEVLLGPDIRCN